MPKTKTDTLPVEVLRERLRETADIIARLDRQIREHRRRERALTKTIGRMEAVARARKEGRLP